MADVLKGTLVSGSDTSITVTKDDGDEESRDLASSCKVTLNGNKSDMESLRAGDKVEVTGDPGKGVAATR